MFKFLSIVEWNLETLTFAVAESNQIHSITPSHQFDVVAKIFGSDISHRARLHFCQFMRQPFELNCRRSLLPKSQTESKKKE